MIEKLILGLTICGCISGTVKGMENVDNFCVDIKSKLPKNELNAILQDGRVRQQMTILVSTLEDASKEYLAYEEMVVNDRIKALADKIAHTSRSDCDALKSVIQELIDYYKSADTTSLQEGFIKKSPDFCFCLGACGYLLSAEQDVDQIREFFRTMTGTSMSKENGLDQIKKSTGENAYWFLQLVDEGQI